MIRYKTETRPGLVALYYIQPGNGAGPFLQPRSLHGANVHNWAKLEVVVVVVVEYLYSASRSASNALIVPQRCEEMSL